MKERIEDKIKHYEECLAVHEKNLAKSLDLDDQSPMLGIDDAVEAVKGIYHYKTAIKELKSLLY